MPLTKPFVVATEGQTIDGRNISRDWINQMAASYSPKVYSAVANLEHWLSLSPDSQFSAQGMVVSLSTQEAELLGDKKLQLLAVVDASESVVAMQQAGKKLVASIEVANNFIGKGIAYLTGLAFTDSPACIGTESMKFSAKKDHIYSFDNELVIEFEKAAAQPSAGDSLFAKVKELLGINGKNNEARFTDIGQAVQAIAFSQKETMDTIAAFSVADLRQELDLMKQERDKHTADFAALQQQVTALSELPNGAGTRPSSTGGNGLAVTDC